jgi:hypothetical protein
MIRLRKTQSPSDSAVSNRNHAVKVKHLTGSERRDYAAIVRDRNLLY